LIPWPVNSGHGAAEPHRHCCRCGMEIFWREKSTLLKKFEQNRKKTFRVLGNLQLSANQQVLIFRQSSQDNS
jgi:hypothetical protein